MSADPLKLLEFDKLLTLLDGYVPSPLGKAKLAAVGPTTDWQAITTRHQRASEAREYLRASGWGASRRGQASPPGANRTATGVEPEGVRPAPTLALNFSAFTEPTHLLEKLAIEGTVLEILEIAEVLSFAEHASDVKRALGASEARFPHLAAEAAGIGEFHSLLRECGGKILPSGELDDHASIELRRIRRDMERQRESILSSLKAFMRAQPEDTAEQNEIITIRSDRFVVPVRASRKSRVAGVIHGASNTGQTVYMEPLETIDLNNELVGLREREHREIQRILAEMTGHLRQRVAELIETTERVAILDLAFGCGRFSLEYDCVIPRMAGGSASPAGPIRLALKNARHPLLEALLRRKGQTVVPLSLVLDDEHRVLVISGPNTGGKTVTLKTLGLLALMAVSGLPVPAEEAEFPLFDRILADIGDYQSIQESLSTFSAHLVNISSMMELADRDSLILLDELGSATDPEEAGALGVAVVDRFRSAGAFTVASTHHMQVKAYATNTPGVLSAHMGFDEQTLEPTYRLEVGSPGKSSGLAIARRLGLPEDVLEHAAQTLSNAHLEVEQFLSRLKEEEAAAAALHRELENKLAELDAKERQWIQEQRRREEQQTAAWQRQLEELARGFEERAGQKLREIAARVPAPSRRSPDAGKEAARMTTNLREQAVDELRQAVVSHLGGAGEDAEPSRPVPMAEPAVGDRVRLKNLRQFGVLLRKNGNRLEVQIGSLRTQASLDDVVEVLPAATPSPSKQTESQSRDREGPVRSTSFDLHMAKASEQPLSEINVIGTTAEEALSRVDKFLDNAFVAQLQRVRVVHGSGKGILRQALAEMFSAHPHVETFAPAPQNEGGAGATIVELRQ